MFPRAIKFTTASQLFVFVVCLAASLFCYYRSQRYRIAVVDSAKVINAFDDMKALTHELQTLDQSFEQKLDTLTREFQSALTQFEQQRASYTNAQLLDEQNKLRLKQENYENYTSISAQQKEKNNTRVEKVLLALNGKISEYARRHGFTAVFGINATGTIIYADNGIDITEDLIRHIND